MNAEVTAALVFGVAGVVCAFVGGATPLGDHPAWLGLVVALGLLAGFCVGPVLFE